MTNQKLKEELKKLPRCPGVYLLKDEGGQIIYVGKAVSLRDRVASHFGQSYNLKTLVMAGQVTGIEAIPVATPAEALILENQLIKKYQPRYNTNLKDGKSYPLVKITRETFPALMIVREEKNGHDFYYGPFTNVEHLKRLVKFLRHYYPVRTCSPATFRKHRVCTEYHLRRCCGPCTNSVSSKEYNRIMAGVKAFFSGHYRRFEKILKRQLNQAVKELRFEEAQLIKERLDLLDSLEKKFPAREEQHLVAYGEQNILTALARLCRLEKIPVVVEGYDVSLWSQDLATGSKVVFRGGHPDKKSYRHYRIQSVANIDDYQMLREIVERRFTGAGRDEDYPDLILVDGGKGQLSAVLQVLSRFNLQIPVLALAKEKEEIYLPNWRQAISLPANSPVLHFLQRVRDEAHLFAFRYQRLLRKKKTLASLLERIPGLGPVRRQKIRERFPDIYRLKQADLDMLKETGVPEKIARRLLSNLKQELAQADG
ncbi:MAG: excinuclease ABC subunit UvrC [Candidatus Omnitrophica bacterium]|nr:excinuclease ABC subunit UvrC [Candidatus Omnitrophota bacterium]